MQQKTSAPAGPSYGAHPASGGTEFAVWSSSAERLWLCLFDARGEVETDRIDMESDGQGRWSVRVAGAGAGPGTRYGFRADGPYDPDAGLWFDPSKLLVDPCAVAIDRPYVYDARLALPRDAGFDTAALMPKAVATDLPEPAPLLPPLYQPGGLIYEVQVRALTKLHPDVPERLRGTVAAMAHPAVIDHLVKLGVSAVELMPVTAWIDERHLGPLGLTNAWGYNPVTFMALDPRLAPGGIAELRETVSALRGAGIGAILDLVFNHTGESDRLGPTLSLRGLDNRAYYRHHADEPGRLVNDTGTGNTLACDHPAVQRLVLASLRHFVSQAGVDGFRFDLAPILGRMPDGFDPAAPLLAEMRDDPVLRDRILIAEPWDIGPGGYQLGRFGAAFLEWNDRFRDDVRRFWRRDAHTVGALATRLAGSSDMFGPATTRSVNFLAAHDGFSLADLVAYREKHNEANGEDNRDGHDENLSWNNGVEGGTDDTAVRAARARDLRALLATLFLSRGAIMLSAGDEFGHSRGGNNNAYAQDNEIAWLDWQCRDIALEDFVAALATLRRSLPVFAEMRLLTGESRGDPPVPDVEWLTEAGHAMAESDWNDPQRRRLTMLLASAEGSRVAVAVNGDLRASVFALPARSGYRWIGLTPGAEIAASGVPLLQGRSCHCFGEQAE
jgi:glycogen operon protein